MRLIDADALKEKLLKERDAIPLTYTERYGFGVEFPNRHGQSMRGGIKKALRCMEQTPTIDAVPVVRCKDCKWAKMVNGGLLRHKKMCECTGVLMDYGDFCSYGERKDGE